MSMIKKVLSLSVLLASMQAMAQDSNSVKRLDEVVVTATKFARKASETGKVITVIDRTVIERSLGKDLSQILTEQAGLVVNGATSNPGKDKSIFLRGAKNDYTVILVNGIPVTDPSGIGGAFDLRMFPLEQIERVEILKGAQSTLYGSDAIAGVINIITRKGSGKPAELYGNLAFGSFGTMNGHIGLRGTAEKVSYNLGFSHHESDGISEALDTLGNQNFDKDGFVRNAFQLDIEGEVVPGLTVKPFFRYSFFKGGYDLGSFSDSKTNNFRSTLLSSGTRVQYQFKKGMVNAQYQYDEVNRNYTEYPFEGTAHLAEIFGQYNINDHLQFLVGIDHRNQQIVDTTATPKNPRIKMTSPYLSVFLKNISGFYLEAGVRYNDHSKYGDNFTYSFNPSYLINRDLKIFANVASAFRAPSIASLFGLYGNNELRPEKSQTYEGGIQASLFNNLIDARVVYFNRRSKDVITTGPGYKLVNLDKQDDHGIEVEPTINITKDLQLKLYYTYIDGEVTTTSAASLKDTTYDNLIRRPKHSFGASIGYQVTKNFYVSTNFYSYSKRNDLYFDPITYAQSGVSMDSYALWNAYAEYRLANNRVRIFADLKNITDAKYQEVYGYGTMGTNITAGVAVRL